MFECPVPGPKRYRHVMRDAHLRALRADERDLLISATVGAMNWCGPRFTREDVVTRPEFAHYTRLVPSRGDRGIVADHAGSIGAAWALFLPPDDAGYGYIDERTPELCLWVDAAHRGHGVGRALLRALAADLASRGVPRVSLSVEDGNDVARDLYLAEGFVAVPGREADGVMILDLAPTHTDVDPTQNG